MKIGFGAALWMRDYNLPGLHKMLDELAMLRCDGVELHFPYIFDAYESRPAYLKELLAIHGLELASVFTRTNFATAETLEKSIERDLRMMDFLAAMGGKNVLLDDDYSVNGNFYLKRPWPEDIDGRISELADIANRLGEEARQRGMQLAWHQHWGTLFESPENFDKFMQKTDASLVGFCPDTAQLKLCGYDEVACIEKYADRVTYVHFKDVERRWNKRTLWDGMEVPTDTGGYNVDSFGRMVELGRGEVNFPAIAEILRKAGFDGWIIDDFDYTGYRTYDSCKACIDYMNNALGVYGERQLKKEN